MASLELLAGVGIYMLAALGGGPLFGGFHGFAGFFGTGSCRVLSNSSNNYEKRQIPHNSVVINLYTSVHRLASSP